MAKLSTFRALFTSKHISDFMKGFISDQDKRMLKAYRFVGEEFIDKAKVNGNYKDQTGNLRASIGYIILKDGKILYSDFIGGKDKGESIGRKVASQISKDYQKGWVFIGVAGMNYAAYVEARSYDVISGSAPGSEDLKSILREIKF